MRIKMSALAGLVALVMTATTAQANYTLTMSESGGPTVVTGGGYTTLAGFTYSNVSVGDFTVTVTVRDTQSAKNAQLYLQSLTVQNDGSAAHTLSLDLVDSAFTIPGAGAHTMKVDSQLSATALTDGGSVSFQSYFNGAPVTATAQQIFSPGGFSDTVVTFTPPADTFSMHNITTITLDAFGSVQETGATTAVTSPEPTSLALALTGAVSFCGAAWARRRRKR